MRRVIIAGVLLVSACGGTGSDDQADGSTTSGQGESESESETGEPPAPLGDACETSVVSIEAPMTLAATLRYATADPEGHPVAAGWGLTGPVVYAKVTVRARADLIVSARGRGFTPRFAVAWPGCNDDPSRVLAEGAGLPVTISDVGPDVDVLIAVAIDAEDPALALPDDSPDPLDFELELELRPVLAELDRCGPVWGRCETGTVCLAELEGELDGDGVDRCRRPPADSCVAPGTLVLENPGAATVIEVAATQPHSDAHEHSCTGWRRPEQVERLELPPGLSETASLVITSDDPRVGLALRSRDCAPEHELACAPATGSGGGTSLSLTTPGLLADLAAAGEGPLLFIELVEPELDADPPAAVQVSVELFD